ncbi:MAG: AgmX/PglI C-terminal domain-containing protein [Bacteriovoracaceae bacterium]|nr:AgmX/PglI C-terminal domain-containing protein [Bacteriovoracaceae bacterium]
MGVRKQVDDARKILKMTCFVNDKVQEEHLLNKNKLLIGSSDQADICINDDHISHYHAMLFLDDNGGKIIDLDSVNGICVNGKRAVESYFGAGDILKVGRSEFHVSEYFDSTSVFNTDRSHIKLVKKEEEESYIPTPPPAKDFTIIDGEYCNITFEESMLSPTDMLCELDQTSDFSSYIDTDETKQFLPIVKHVTSKSIQVTVLSNGNVISVDYLKIKNKNYYLSANQKNGNTILIPSLSSDKKVPFIKIRSDIVNILKIDDFDKSYLLSEQCTNPFSDNDQIEFFNEDVLYLSQKSVQIIIKVVDTPPQISSTPFFGRDREFKIHMLKISSILMSVMLLLLFIDVTDLKMEPKKKLSIIYKRAQKPRPNERPKERMEVKSEPVAVKRPEVKQKVAKVKKPNIAKPTKARKVIKTAKKVRRVKKPIKRYQFKMKKALTSLFNGKPKKNIKFKQKLNVSSFSSSSSLVSKKISASKTRLKVGRLGNKTKRYDRSYGTKGIISKKNFDTAYIDPKTVVLGSMDPELLRKILTEYLPQFRHCYQQELIHNSESTKGVINLNFTIGKTGKVSKIKIDTKSANFSSKGVRCMSRILRLIDFPKPKGGGVVDIRQPLNFFSET